MPHSLSPSRNTINLFCVYVSSLSFPHKTSVSPNSCCKIFFFSYAEQIFSKQECHNIAGRYQKYCGKSGVHVKYGAFGDGGCGMSPGSYGGGDAGLRG